MPILSNFPGGSGSGGGISLAAVSNITTKVGSEKVYVKWTDPGDIVVNESILAEWAGTLLVRKAGSVPASRRDGTVVLDSKTRNAYQSEYFCDSGLTNGTVYYYKFFPYTTTNTYTEHEDCEFTATPEAPIMGDVSGMSAIAAGNGKLAIKWTDPAATVVDDGLTLATWAKTTVVVKAGSYATSPDDEDVAYQFVSTTRNAYANSPLTATGLTNGTTYYVSFFPESTDGAVNVSESNRFSGVANRMTISTVPSQSGSLTYTGSAQTPSWSNYDNTKLTLSVTGQTNAGTYSASFTPKDDYMWSDGTITAKSVSWKIGKAAGSLTLSASSVTLNSNTTSKTVTVTRPGNGTITATSNNTGVATVSVSGTTLTISSVNSTTGTTTITVKVAAGTNHTAPANKTISVSAEFLPAVGTALNDCSWDDVSKISAQGLGANYWSVGDTKGVALSGTASQLSLGGTYYVYILGFNHNGATNTIDFGTFKTALSGGKDIALVSGYDDDSDFYMNSSATNSGGWKSSYMRYSILGSTNTQNGNATTTTATSPVSKTLMSTFPADLRAVMKPMTIYTDNTGGGSNTASNVTSTVDYLPLLAELEIFGSRTYANSAEQNYQAQYAYYSSGNSKVKYNHSSTGSTVHWWERSPYYYGSGIFCYVNSGGGANRTPATNSRGVAPAFRV